MREFVRASLARVLEQLGQYEEDYVLELDQPRDPSHGDLTTNIALILAQKLDRKPRELAGEIAAQLEVDRSIIDSVEIAGPGFINFRAAGAWWTSCLRKILEQGDNYGRSEDGDGQRVNIEFVSANPTGPWNIVSARAASVGSALARTMEAAGYRPHSEFYCNDAGRQVRLFGASVRARYAEVVGIGSVEFPEEGYRGEYVTEMGRELALAPDKEPDTGDVPKVGRIQGRLPEVSGTPAQWMELEEKESAEAFGRYALVRMIADQRKTCTRFGLVFDTWFLESDLHRSDRLMPTLERLKGEGHVYEKDGATWFRSTDFSDEKDRVVLKADGAPTYFLSDIAYHLSKHERGTDHAIDFLGPDHHGHIARMESAMEGLGLPADWLEIIVLQQVNLILDGKPLEMSKRAGRLVTVDQLIDEVGVDVAKFFFLARKNTSHMDFDLDLAKAESNENPVYYVKYAHARICSVLRNAEARGLDFGGVSDEELSRLEHAAEHDLLRLLPELAGQIASAARSREMSRLTSFAMEVASAFHPFYHQCTILSDDDGLSRARLALCQSTRIVLANTLRLIGVDAPERM